MAGRISDRLVKEVGINNLEIQSPNSERQVSPQKWDSWNKGKTTISVFSRGGHTRAKQTVNKCRNMIFFDYI